MAEPIPLSTDAVRNELAMLRHAVNLDKGGGPPYDGGMEHRVTALETRLDTVLPTLATKADLAELKSEVHKGFGEMVKWIVGTGFVGLAALITIMSFVLNNATPKAAPPVQQAPIIINVPAQAATPEPSAGK